MRVTTDFWVAALLRRVFADGGFGAVVRRGATEAGAVFVLTRDRMGGVSLYGPAAQASYDTARPDNRQFTLIGEHMAEDAVDKRFQREMRFDPDFWVVELEPGKVPTAELLSIATA
jgi:hypothetical protein